MTHALLAELLFDETYVARPQLDPIAARPSAGQLRETLRGTVEPESFCTMRTLQRRARQLRADVLLVWHPALQRWLNVRVYDNDEPVAAITFET